MKKSVYIFAVLMVISLAAFRQPPTPQPQLLKDYPVIDAPNVPLPTVQPRPTGTQCPDNHISMPLPNPPCVPISRPTPPGGIGLP